MRPSSRRHRAQRLRNLSPPSQVLLLLLPLPQRGDFRCGDKVAFEDHYLATQVGTITRINQRTATVDTADGQSWRVGFALLRHVVDV